MNSKMKATHIHTYVVYMYIHPMMPTNAVEEGNEIRHWHRDFVL